MDDSRCSSEWKVNGSNFWRMARDVATIAPFVKKNQIENSMTVWFHLYGAECYNWSMNAKLTPEQLAALQGEPTMEMVDPNSGRVFVLIDKALFDVQQDARNITAVQQGIDDMQAGRGMTPAQARATSLQQLSDQHGE